MNPPISPTHARESLRILQKSSKTYPMESMKHYATPDTNRQHQVEVSRACQHTQRENEPAFGGMGAPVASTAIFSSVSSPPRTIASSAKKSGRPIRKMSPES